LEIADQNQSAVIRFFPYDNIPRHKEIISRIKKCNFKFIVLKRQNIQEQILSYGVALATGVWQTLDRNYQTPKVAVDDFTMMTWLYERIQNFDNWLADMDIDYDEFRYETVRKDISRYLNTSVKLCIYGTKKQNKGDAWDKITNVEQLRLFFDSLQLKE
jgi:LPS sulfotransferase NodH